MLVAPSVLCADFSRLGEDVVKVEKAGADWVHLDVMDGAFVPNITFGPIVVQSLRRYTQLPFDVHLMIERPEQYVEEFAKAGADIITVHAESTRHLHRLVSQIRDLGKKAGVSLNPATPVCMLEEVVPYIDMVLIMSVNPGFGGQKFIPESVDKVRAVKALLDAKNASNVIIQVDGGVNGKNVQTLADAGCSCVVAGSYVFGAENMAEAVASLKVSLR